MTESCPQADGPTYGRYFSSSRIAAWASRPAPYRTGPLAQYCTVSSIVQESKVALKVKRNGTKSVKKELDLEAGFVRFTYSETMAQIL